MCKKTVLLVEDSATVRQAEKKALETKGGYEVLEFPDGATATATLTARKPHIDAAVLDIVMMGHGGSIKDYLRKIPEYKEIPILFHTSLVKEQFDNRILEGAHYVQKGRDSIMQVVGILKGLVR